MSIESQVIRCGVRYQGAQFVSHHLVDYTKQTVTVKPDPNNPDLVEVHTTDGEHICLARRLGS